MERQVRNDTNLLFAANKKKIAMDVMLKNVQVLTNIKKKDFILGFKVVKEV